MSCCNDVMNHADCVIKRDVYLQKMHSCSKHIRHMTLTVKVALRPQYNQSVNLLTLSQTKNLRLIEIERVCTRQFQI